MIVMKGEDPNKRPYIPLDIQCIAAMLQLGYPMEWIRGTIEGYHRRFGELKRRLLHELRVVKGWRDLPLHLDHNPALARRYRNRRTGKYKPDANDPKYLQWIPGKDHLTKTAGRGGEKMRFGGDIREVRKTRNLESAPEKWRDLTKPKKRKAKKMSVARWAKGRKIQSRGFGTKMA